MHGASMVLLLLSGSLACQSGSSRPSADPAATSAQLPPAASVSVSVTSASANPPPSAQPTVQPAGSQDAIDKRVSAEKHTAFVGPVTSIEALCKEVNDDYAKRSKTAVTVCTPGPKKVLAGGPVQEIGAYTVQMPESASNAYLAVRTSKGWFVQQRTFADGIMGRLSHHTPVGESLPLDRARQTSAGLFVVHVREVHSYQPGMGNLGRSETTTESLVHCNVDAQGTPSCTSAVEVVSRQCNGFEKPKPDCTETNLLGASTP